MRSKKDIRADILKHKELLEIAKSNCPIIIAQRDLQKLEHEIAEHDYLQGKSR